MRHALPPFVQVTSFMLYVVDPTSGSAKQVATISVNETLVVLDAGGFFEASTGGRAMWAIDYTVHGKRVFWEATYLANGMEYILRSNESLIDFNAAFQCIFAIFHF